MSIYFDNSTVTQMSLNVAGDTVIVYPEEKEFADASSVSGWAAENMRWAVDSGIINGSVKDGKYYMNPKE